MRLTGGEAGRHYSGRMRASEILAIGAAELGGLLILLIVVVVPVAAIAFARSGKGYSEIGKGRFAVDFGEENEPDRQDEIRQLVEAKAYRQAQRGETPVDVERETERLLRVDTELEPGAEPSSAPDLDPETTQIREEMRQVVIAKNESRERRGEEPLDVEAEVDRMLAEFDL